MLRITLLPLIFGLLLHFAPTAEPDADSSDAPAQIDECSFRSEVPVAEDYMSLVSIADPYLGDMESSVTVIEFFNPNCPHCATFHPVMKQVVGDMGAHARFFLIPFPLWQYSLVQTEALYVAAQEGKYFDMLDAQYLHQKQGGMSMDEVTVLAGDIGLETAVFRQRLEQGLNQRMILERRQQIAEMGVRGTPSVMINGQLGAGDSLARICLNQLIADEAKKAQG